MELTITSIFIFAIIGYAAHLIGQVIFNSAFHPLGNFPGPILVSTGWYRTIQEVFLGRSWFDVLVELHAAHGEIVRVGPGELHFSNPTTYHEIYNNANRWDKESSLYQCFGEDRSSFGFLTYHESKQRKDVLAPLFSRRAILDLQSLVKKNVDRMCEALAANETKGKSSDMLYALRCFTLDTIINYCFGKDVHATEAPDFQAPITVAMDATTPAFTIFRHFELIRLMVFNMPGWFTKLTNPAMSGLIDLQSLLGAQVDDVIRNPQSLEKASHPIIYHRLLDPAANQASGGVPSRGSLYEEAQALLFGGAESSANTTMLGTFHLLQQPDMVTRLHAELRTAWPDLARMPDLETLEQLPYLSAVIKESLRVAPSVPAALPRVVPASGATLNGVAIPPGTVVGMSLVFLHRAPAVFANPTRFDPDRWLHDDKTAVAALERSLVPFSRGPRACLGQNLAMCELYLAFAALFRRFELVLDGTTAADLRWRECFLPLFGPKHMRAFCRPVKD